MAVTDEHRENGYHRQEKARRACHNHASVLQCDRRAPEIDKVVEQLPRNFPEDVAHAIFQGMRSQAKRLQEQSPT